MAYYACLWRAQILNGDFFKLFYIIINKMKQQITKISENIAAPPTTNTRKLRSLNISTRENSVVM